MGLMTKHGSIFGASMLVAGTCIGGGILAFPVVTAQSGFFPALAMMLMGWIFMTLSALYLVEACLWQPEGHHFLSLASKLLGPLGKGIAWVLYLFIAYTSLVGYIAGGGHLLGSVLQMPDSIALPLFTVVFGSVFYLGSIFLGRINSLLMIGLIAAYCVLIAGGLGHVNIELLKRKEWGATFYAFPLLLTIFSFQTIIPSLTSYLNRDAKALKLSVLIGTCLTLLFYIAWQILILGTVDYEGDAGLKAALQQGLPATAFLGAYHPIKWIGTVADFFAFTALVTSFLGIGLGLFDFLADALRISKKGWGWLTLGLLVALPSLFFAMTIEKVFLKALDISGGIGDAILNCMIPALMMYSGRYIKTCTFETSWITKKGIILSVFAYGFVVFAIEILGKLGWITAVGG
jgi:tyrosine-specific transport protein